MKTGFKKKTMLAALTLACMCSLTGGAVLAANAESESATTVQTLSGFDCKGVSVRADQIGMRFEFNLSGDAIDKKDNTAGVVYMPYDLYTGDTANFTKDTAKSATADFTWKDNTATEDTSDLVGYTYMDAEVIPSTMYNRVLLVRGYIEDGENVYYTDPVKTSMAYSAWKGIAALGEDSKMQLQKYMGPYTLTYGDGENDKVSGLYYGDTFTLPNQIDGYTENVSWYWDENKTQEIKSTDYATGSMRVYYKLADVSINGTVSCAESSVDLSKVKISVDGVEQAVTVGSDGKFVLTMSAGKHDLKFYCDGYVGFVYDFDAKSSAEVDAVTLVSNLYAVGDYKSTKSTTAGYDRTDTDGTLEVTENNYNLIFPNTATTGDFNFKVTTTKENTTDEYILHGIEISNGEKILSFYFRKWGCVYVRVTSADGTYKQLSYYVMLTDTANATFHGDGKETVHVERTADKITLYREYNNSGNKYGMLSITKDGVTPINSKSSTLSDVEDTLTSSGELQNFFGNNVELAVGIGSSYANNTKMTYVCSFEKKTDTQAQSYNARNIDVIADDDKNKA